MADTSATAAANSCPCCKNPGSKICSECKDIKYCSVECQKKDWKFHKQLCKSVKEFRERPAANMRRVVCFPADGDEPEFRWMKVKDYEEEDWQDVETSGTDLAHASRPMDIAVNVRTERMLPELIVFKYDENFNMHYGWTNPALYAATSQELGHDWQGPIIAYTGATNGQGFISNIQDFSMSQYSALIAWFIARTTRSSNRLMGLSRDGMQPDVQAAQIFTECDDIVDAMQSLEITLQAVLGQPGGIVYRYECVGGDFSAISKRISMPVIGWRNSGDDQDSDYQDSEYHSDDKKGSGDDQKSSDDQDGDDEGGYNKSVVRSIRSMFIVINEDVEKFGTISPGWGKVGQDVLLVRCGDEPHDLDVKTATVFAAYCRYHVAPFVQWALEAKRAERLPRIQRVWEEVTPGKWASYQSQYQKMQDKSAEVSKEAVGDVLRMGLTEKDEGAVVARILGVQLLDLVALAFD